MKKIDRETLVNLTRQARQSERLRINLNLHNNYHEPCQRLFIAIEPGSYIRPHRHADPPKPECFIVIRGAMLLLTFTDSGDVREKIYLEPGGECLAVDIPAGTWHSALSLKPGTIFFETKPGPYLPLSDKDFAPWAPEEGACESAAYLEKLRSLAVTVQDSGDADA